MTDKLSAMLIRESSDLDDDTDDDMELHQENLVDVQEVSKKLFTSQSEVDQRLIEIYGVKRNYE